MNGRSRRCGREVVPPTVGEAYYYCRLDSDDYPVKWKGAQSESAPLNFDAVEFRPMGYRPAVCQGFRSTPVFSTAATRWAKVQFKAPQLVRSRGLGRRADCTWRGLAVTCH